MYCYLFPGQGIQSIGMGKMLFDHFPEHTEQASQILGYCIKTLCLSGPPEKLDDTRYSQPAIYVVNALNYLVMLEECGAPKVALGHSLGEYNALQASGLFSFTEGLVLVKQRAEAMAQANGGGMVAVIGMPVEKLRFIMKRSGLRTLEIANLNTHEQTVVSGTVTEDIQLFAEIIEDAGATMVKVLNVSGAFHSSAMLPTTQEFRHHLTDYHFSGSLQFPVIANVSAQPYQRQEAGRLLAQQLISPVRWHDSINYVDGIGDMEFAEVGGTSILISMVRKIRQHRSEA
ncbi:ACP S-malonyltransferase [Xenorhabdus bovienii]|uniref:ACP S-malonyltransferase n=1 Tax=Xenorhabdus bovienii TaxID=40576 RepID=UPI0023B2CA48|nr:ACP S-malonyltransferase [Xenorhabdus bovienii]MDE9436115.1 ACP S-malonyltransferase [Xenorhabdus bovienii]MDE9497924.1 ACP S-malonyltransferase [Xenorhabdus bovienii]